MRTSGNSALALVALSTGATAGTATVTSDVVVTQGTGSNGIVAQSTSTAGNAGPVTVNSNTALAYGNGSTGITAISNAVGGTSGAVNVTSNVATITYADATVAIFAQSTGTGGNANITVTNNGDVIGGNGGVAVQLNGGVNNTINNSTFGYMNTFGPIATSATIEGSIRNDTVNNDGQEVLCPVHCEPTAGPGIYGNVFLSLGANAINNNLGAYFAPGNEVYIGTSAPNGSLLTNAGTISPHDFYRVGTTNVTGNFTQTATGRYLNDVDFSNNTADRINILGGEGSGIATLGGRVYLSINNPGWAAPNTYDITILDSQSRNGTTFAGLDSPQTAVFQSQLTYPTVGSAHLVYNINFAPSGLTNNQSAVGGAVNAIQTFGVPAFRPVAAQLFFVPTVPQLGAIYDTLSGEGVAGAQQSVFYARNQFFDTVMSQSMIDPGRVQPYRVWISGYGGSGHVNGSSGIGKNDYDAYGGALGVDYMINPNALVGLAIGGGRSNFSVPDRSTTGKGDNVNVALYGEATFPLTAASNLYLRGLLSYGHSDNSTAHNNVGLGLQQTDPWNYISPRLTTVGPYNTRGSNNSDLFGGRVELGWRNQFGQLNVTPFVNIQFDNQSNSSFSEQNGGLLGLRFGSRNVTSVPMSLGVQLDGTFQVGSGMTITPKARIAWVHEFDAKRTVSAEFLSAPGFRWNVNGAPAVEDAARLDLGAQLNITPALAVEGNFIGYFASRGTAVGGMGTLKYRF